MRRWISTTQDRVLLDAIAFLLAHKGLHSKWLAISHARLKDDLDSPSLLDLSFLTHKWWPLVTGIKIEGLRLAASSAVTSRFAFSNVMLELKSGDLCIPGSGWFRDYRKELGVGE